MNEKTLLRQFETLLFGKPVETCSIGAPGCNVPPGTTETRGARERPRCSVCQRKVCVNFACSMYSATIKQRICARCLDKRRLRRRRLQQQKAKEKLRTAGSDTAIRSAVQAVVKTNPSMKQKLEEMLDDISSRPLRSLPRTRVARPRARKS